MSAERRPPAEAEPTPADLEAGETCADAASCPRSGECREVAERAWLGDAEYERLQAWVREVVDAAPPPSAGQLELLRGLFARPTGPRPPRPCPRRADATPTR